METTFEKLEQPLKELLTYFEFAESYNTAVRMISGGYTSAEYDDFDEDYVYITLRWGVCSDVEDSKHTEHYKIAIDDLLGDVPVKIKYRAIRDA